MATTFNDIYAPITEEALSRIPAGMKAAKRWVIWGGKKTPVNGNIKNKDGYFIGADITDPKTWLDFETARQLIGSPCYLRRSEEYFHVAGVGFVVGDGYFCFDADGGAAHGREPVPEAVIQDVTQRTGAYTEMSISGNGSHTFGMASFVTDPNREHYSESKTTYEIECFTRRKFIAITGNRIPGSADDIRECTEAARQIYEEYIRIPCTNREEEEAKKRAAERSAMVINPDDADQFFLLNYETILQYADPDHFKRGGKGGRLSAGEYSWIGAIKAMREIGVPDDAIINWCRRGSSFAGEKDVLRVLNEQKSGRKCSTAALVKDAKENGWQPDLNKLTGEAKENHAKKIQRDEENEQALAEFKKQSREKLREFCKGKGIVYNEKLAYKANSAGEYEKIVDTETGEVVYKMPSSPESAPSTGADSDRAAAESTGATLNRAAEIKPGTAPAQQKPAVISVGGFEDVEIKPTDYLFFPWFPRGKLTAVQGDSSSSKSTFMYAVGAKVSTGADLMGAPCEDPGNVMFITIEDDAPDIKIAFVDAGGDETKLRRIMDREQITSLDLSPAGADVLNRIIKSENIKLLVLDPLQQFLGGDMNKANETRPQLGRLMNIAAENNISIVFLEHMGKDTSKSALHRGLGSVDIGAATRSIIQIVTDPQDDNYKIAFTVKNNTADMHETRKAIRYQVKDHPGSIDRETKKRLRFHGHAEFVELIPEYNEQIFRKAVRKIEEEEASEMILTLEYGKDPLVLTARKLIEENPSGIFIGSDDLIQKITQVCGRCPYDQSKSNQTGINNRVTKLRAMMIDNDGIQIDIQSNSIYPRPYNWRGELEAPEHIRTKGFTITAVQASREGSQQTKI